MNDEKTIIFSINNFSNYYYMVKPYEKFLINNHYKIIILHINSVEFGSELPPVTTQEVQFIDLRKIKFKTIIEVFRKNNISGLVLFAFQSLKDTLFRIIAMNIGVKTCFIEHGLLDRNISGNLKKPASFLFSIKRYLFYSILFFKILFHFKKFSILKNTLKVFFNKKYYTLKFDKYLLYANNSKNIIESFFGHINKNNFKFSGYPIFERREEIKVINTSNVVLYIHQTFIYKGNSIISYQEEKKFLLNIKEVLNKYGYKFEIILHPNESLNRYKQNFINDDMKFHQNENNLALIKDCKFVIGHWSTLLFTPIILKKPIAIFKYPNTKITINLFNSLSFANNTLELSEAIKNNRINININTYNNFYEEYIGFNNAYEDRVKNLIFLLEN